ncbi:MAG: delta-class carbonic anhydrase [Sulfurovum sp.]|nr:delta-class carbonic anhydrase [Sulfurovum sp.]
MILSLLGCNNSSNLRPDNYVGNTGEVSNEIIAQQRTVLKESIVGQDVGAQSPRNIDVLRGSNLKATVTAPASTEMYLCDIHFHKNAEHKGGEFTTYAGNGNAEGYGTGYKYSGTLTEEEKMPSVIEDKANTLSSGDTIEVHYVYSGNAYASLGNGLGTCFGDVVKGTQPLLRVETQVYVLVSDETALDFKDLTKVSMVNGRYQAENIPSDTGTPIEYEGSTTGPGYNTTVSPYQVTWRVRPNIAKVNITTVGEWLNDNNFEEHYAHAVRNLVLNTDLLSDIQ